MSVADVARDELLRCLFWHPSDRPAQTYSTSSVPGNPCSLSDVGAFLVRHRIAAAEEWLGVEFSRLAALLAIAFNELEVDRRHWPDLLKLRQARELLVVDKQEVAAFVVAAAKALHWLQLWEADNDHFIDEQSVAGYGLEQIIREFGSRRVPWAAAQLREFVLCFTHCSGTRAWRMSRAAAIVGELLCRPEIPEMLDENCLAVLPAVREQLADYAPTALDRKRIAAIDAALGKASAGESIFNEIAPWSKAANASFAALTEVLKPGVAELCRHASTCNPSRVSKDWLRIAQVVVNTAGADKVGSLIREWIQIAIDGNAFDYDYFGNSELGIYKKRDENTIRLCGLAWIVASLPDDAGRSALADAVEFLARGKRDSRVQRQSFMGACVRAIAAQGKLGLPLLNRLAMSVKWPPMRKVIAKQLEEATRKSGLSAIDAEETFVPDFGLVRGRRRIEFAPDLAGEIHFQLGDKPAVTWHLADKATRVLPKAAATTHKGKVSELKVLVADIEKSTVAQRRRLDLLLRRPTSWRMADWRARYLDHGLLHPLVTRLIWMLEGTPVLASDGRFSDVRGDEVRVDVTADVSIWHPALRPAEEVRAWRDRLAHLELSQPFKQAHREVYLLTDAERRTETYSNRFAAHVVNNQATLAISQVRRWKMGLYGSGTSTPTIALPHFQIRAEWWTQPAGPDENHFGYPKYLSTDQVRFYEEGSNEPMPLHQVPPLAFTEVMRDVDLFVSIASIGNDPNWLDRGAAEQYNAYWNHFSFGDLTESAKTRKAVLETLLPRLTRIRDRCRLEDKFLIVRGELRTYKIHLGSGNILMEPNDQYLCIVPDRKPAPGGEKLFLPFEGDSTLAIVLSKAFMLADDTSIKDPSITRQIRL